MIMKNERGIIKYYLIVGRVKEKKLKAYGIIFMTGLRNEIFHQLK